MNNTSHNSTIIQKKPKRKFNFIDFLIILVVVAIVGILIYVFSPWSHIEKLWTNNKVELTYFVEIKDVDIAYIESIKEGDGVINSVNKSSLGTVSEISKLEKAYVYDYVLNEQGEMTCIRSEHPQKYNITLKIVATAEYDKGVGYSVNGRRIAIGELLDLRFPQYTCSGTCTQIYK